MTGVAARAIALALALPLPTLAAPPNACAIVKIEVLNEIAAGAIEGTQVRKAGNPSECSPSIGDNALWLPANKQLVFRKNKTIASVTFSRPANQTEVDTAQVARLVEAQIK